MIQTVHLIVSGMGKGSVCELDLTLDSESLNPATLNDLAERVRAMLVLQFPHGTVLHSRITPAREQKEANHGEEEV